MSRLTAGVFAVLVGLAGLSSCGGDNSSSNSAPVSADLSDPQAFEAAVRRTFLPGTGGVLDAVDRVLAALNGGPLDGVVIAPPNITISVDLNGDGSRESTINAQLTDTDLGMSPTLSVLSIVVPQVPSLVADGAATVTQTAPGTIVFDNISGFGTADPPGDGNFAEVFFNGGSVSLDLVTGNPSGGLDVSIIGDGGFLDVSISFEPDGQGGFRVRFVGSGFNFTVP